MAQGVKRPKHSWINDWTLIRKAEDVKEQISPALAKQFMDELSDRRVPGWVSELVDLEILGIVANG